VSSFAGDQPGSAGAIDQMTDRARQTVEPDDDERVAGADLAQQPRQGRADA
jgi:hypothetical protein